MLDALQKVYISSVLQLFYNIIYWGLILTALILGFKLPEIGLAVFIAAFIWLITIILSAINEWGALKFKSFNINFKFSAKKQINYGLKIYTSGLENFFYEPLSKILISNFIGVAEVGFYDIALRLRNQLWGLIESNLSIISIHLITKRHFLN